MIKRILDNARLRSDHGGHGSHRAAKDALFDAFAEVAKALASGRRAEIADLLAQGERPVEEIAAEIGQSVANTSHHLRAMARAGMVATRRDGTRIFYRLASDRVVELWAAMRDVAAEHVAGLERLAAAYLGERDGIEVVGREELAARLGRGEVVVLDVRPSPSMSPATSWGPARCPSPSSAATCAPSRKAPRSSPTAGGRTASTPTTRSESSTAAVSVPGA